MVSAGLVQMIETLQQRIRDHLNRQLRPNEDDTIRIFILPLLAALGWEIEDLDEVKGQYRHRSKDNPVDYALCLQRSPVLFVEAKSLNERLEDRKWVVQTLNYANTAGVDWCVLTNGNEYRYYKTHARGEAEKKHFLTTRIDSEESMESRAAKFTLISRDRMGQRDIDALWTNSRTDSQIRNILETLLEEESIVRLIKKRSDGLKPKEIRASLLRASLRVDYPDIGELPSGEEPPEQVGNGTPETLDTSGKEFHSFDNSDDSPDPIKPDPPVKGLPRIKVLLELGLLSKDMILRIRNHKGSEATVIDSRRVIYKGEQMLFNAWGCLSTGWSAINIYVHVETEDGRLLQDLRLEAVRILEESK